MIVKEGNKYYYIYEGTKTEIDEDRVKQFVLFADNALNSFKSNAEVMGDYLSTSQKYLENKSYKIGELPHEFDNVVRIDMFINRLENDMRNEFPDLCDVNSKKEIAKRIEQSILITREQLSNPLLEEKRGTNEYLLNRLIRLKASFENIEVEDSKNKSVELDMSQVALMYAYQKLTINPENSAEIASKFGFNSKTSGHRLYQLFCTYNSPRKRKAKPDNETRKTWQNKINLLESVVELLPADKQKDVHEKISILKSLYKNAYP